MNHYDETSDEFSGVVDLMKKFGDYFNTLPHVNGTIHLYNNIDLPGCGIRHDIDILMVGELENYSVDCSGDKVTIENFCTCIERKRSDASKIYLDGTHLMVTYAGDPRPTDVTKQSNEQVNLYQSFCQARHVRTPFIVNLIWLAGITEQSLNSAWPEPHNAFASTYSVEHIFRKIASKRKYGQLLFKSSVMSDFISEMDRLFASEKKFKPITWKVMNAFSDEKAKAAYDAYVNNDDLTVFAGRAGTGKTYTLLQIAVYLTKKGRKCLFLTYNKALVSDTRYLLSHLSTIGDMIDVKTRDSYMRDIMVKVDRWDDNQALNDFNSYLQGQETAIVKCSMDLKPINKDSRGRDIYDYVFLDEAQDWTEDEKEILLNVFEKKQVVVADGIDQFISGQRKLDWGDAKPRTMSMRQMTNIVDFVNRFAAGKLIDTWSVDADPHYAGGRVIIADNFNSNVFKERILQQIRSIDGDPYDALFLIPGSRFDADAFIRGMTGQQIRIFNGTVPEERCAGYPLNDTGMCRLYDYESCRGLEGWATICLKFDALIRIKIAFYRQGNTSQKVAVSKAYQWALMPLTRAVEVLYITFEDPQSVEAQYIKSIAKDLRGSCEII